MLDEATVQGNDAVEALPTCRAEVLNKEQEVRKRFNGKVLKLTDERTGLFGKLVPEILITNQKFTEL